MTGRTKVLIGCALPFLVTLLTGAPVGIAAVAEHGAAKAAEAGSDDLDCSDSAAQSRYVTIKENAPGTTADGRVRVTIFEVSPNLAADAAGTPEQRARLNREIQRSYRCLQKMEKQ
jgi:hypothetical protein